MSTFSLAGRSVRLTGASPGTFDLMDATDGGTLLQLIEDSGPCPDLNAGRLPDPCRALFEAIFAEGSDMIDRARAATAAQLWDKYAGGWQSGDPSPARDAAAFSAALGRPQLSFYLHSDGTVSLVSLAWENCNLFWGHSIFTQVFEPATWSNFDATIFG